MVDEEMDNDTRSGNALTDSLRRALINGISALFMTEEGIRNAISDLRLPKEAISNLIQQTQNSRRDVMRTLSDELRNLLGTVDMARILRKALSGMKLEIKADIRLSDDMKTSKTTSEDSDQSSKQS